MNGPRKEGTAAVAAAVRKIDELSDNDLSHDEELLKDRMLGIAYELEMIKKEKKQPGKKKEGTVAVAAAVRKHDELSDDDGRSTHDEELLKDRMLGIANELEILIEEKKQHGKKKKARVETRSTKKKKKAKVETARTKKKKAESLSDQQELTPEHLLIRVTREATVKWYRGMRDKYMAGVVSEMMGKIIGHLNAKTEFPPPGSEVYPKWTKDIMDEARIGWQKYKTYNEAVDKYPLHDYQQSYCWATGEWTMRDCSHLNNSLFKRKDG